MNYVSTIRRTSANPVTMEMNMANVFGLISLMGPGFVMFMLFCLSLFNSNLKGLFYLVGVGVVYGFVVLVGKSGMVLSDPSDKKDGYYPSFCQMFGSSTTELSNPSFNSAFYTFTLTYLLIPMITHQNYNIFLILFFLCLLGLDTLTRSIFIKCTSFKGASTGGVIGTTIGFLYWLLLSSYDTKSFLYYNDFDSSRVACMRPTKQKFKCNVYRNGELLESI
jgi:hypothetical protein